MGKSYTIISGKGGVGKTTTAINLGMALNRLGEDVIIVDANFTTPNIGVNLGAPVIPITINHVLSNNARIEDAIYEHDNGTKVMPASLSLREIENLNYSKLIDVVKNLKKLSDYVLIDGAAGLGREARASIEAGDEIIVVTNPEISAVTDALKTVKLAEEMGKLVLGVIVTRYTGRRYDMSLENIKEMLELPILGIVPEENSVREAQILKNSVVYTHPRSKASRSYLKISRRLAGLELDYEYEGGFFVNLLRKLGIK